MIDAFNRFGDNLADFVRWVVDLLQGNEVKNEPTDKDGSSRED